MIKPIAICLLWLLCNPVVSLCSDKMTFMHLSLAEGLSQSTVYDIEQDSYGQLWIATGNGLNRYNGAHFTVFTNNSSDANSILDNSIRSIFFDSSGVMWVGTQMGLAMYDATLEQFVNYPFFVGNTKINVCDIVEIGKGEYIIGTNIGLYMFSPGRGYQKCSSPEMTRISRLIKCHDGTILLATDIGLYTYTIKTDSYRLTHRDIYNVSVLAIAPHISDKNKVWVGTEGNGFYLLNLAFGTHTNYRHNAADPQSVSSNYVRSFCYDDDNRLWVGTFVGLNIMHKEDNIFERHYHELYDERTISQSSIKSMLLDSQGGMWCGTYYGGLSYYHKGRERFTNYRNIPGQNSLNDNVLSVMAVDKRNNIWIGTNENGLNYFNRSTNLFSYYKHQPSNPSSIPANNVKALLFNNDNTMWVGTHGGGLSLFNESSGRFLRVNVSNSPTSNDLVYALAKDRQGRLWVGTLDGLFIYDHKSGRSTQLIKDKHGMALANPHVVALYVDSRERIWIGTDNGVSLYNQDKECFEPFDEATQNNRSIYCFFEDREKNMWIGSQSGLFRFDSAKGRLIDMNTAIGFPQSIICGIQQDTSGLLWIGSGNGLISLNPSSDKWVIYTQQDGIQSNQFSLASYCTDANGEMFFGGVNGMTSFFPDEIELSKFAPAPLLDNLLLSYMPVAPMDDTGILKQSLRKTKKIKLSPDQSIFSINFSVPNFLSGHNNSFAYQLSGFDKDWVYTKEGIARYSNLTPGRYTFSVRASNSDGVWSNDTTELEVVIMPQWWNTWWARLLFVIVLAAATVMAVRIYAERKFMQRELELERKQKQRNEELSESKIRFLINVSHEFRTPLTLIISPLHEVLSKGIADRWLREQIELVHRNAKRMMHLINQVLDYRRSEIGAMTLQVVKKSAADDVRDIFKLFEQVARNKDINYTFYNNMRHTEVYYDPNFMERILSNLISNAIKYTSQGESIEVSVSDHNNSLIVEVEDTGCGIAIDKQKSIFDRFYQVDDMSQGSGIGLSLVNNLVTLHKGTITVESQPGKGSRFVVTLPCDKQSYSDISSEQSPSSNLHAIAQRDIQYMNNEDTDIASGSDEESKELLVEDTNRKTILLVEDDNDVRNYLKDNLSVDYNVVTAENGKQALGCLEQTAKVDIVVSDVMMPVMDGIKLCKYIKHNIQYSHIPVILLTAKNDVSTHIDGLQSGADDYMSKPFVYTILSSKIGNILKTRDVLLLRYASSTEPNIAELATNTTDQEFLQKAIAIIEKHMDNSEFSTQDFSSEMGMSRSNLYIKIKALTNESPIVFIRRIRFNYACKLLKEGRYNVSEISAIIGLSPSYFATSFKKYMGCMPSAYVKRDKHSETE